MHWLDQIPRHDELDVLRWVFANPRKSVRDCHLAMHAASKEGLSLDRIGKVLRKLRRAGLVDFSYQRGEGVYHPLVTQEELDDRWVSFIAENLFQGDIERLRAAAERIAKGGKKKASKGK